MEKGENEEQIVNIGNSLHFCEGVRGVSTILIINFLYILDNYYINRRTFTTNADYVSTLV